MEVEPPSKKKNISEDWVKRLPQISRKIEIMLFRRSSSLEEYLDTSTIRKRIKLIAQDMNSTQLITKY